MSKYYEQLMSYMGYPDIIGTFSFYDSVECYQGRDYLFITPKQGGNYIPYLLHTQISDGLPATNAGAAVIDDILNHNHEQPPFILITEGKSGLKNFMHDGVFNMYVPLVNMIITINGEQAYAYECKDNIPQEIIDIIPPWLTRKPISNAGLFNQTLSAMYNIPSILVHPNVLNPFEYNEKLYNDAIITVTQIMNSYDGSVIDYVHTPLPAPGHDGTGSAKMNRPWSNNHACSMCGKQRLTKYFFRINAYLCSKCEARIKHHGTVNYPNHVKALAALQRQRELTRIANALKNMKTCPRCQCKTISWLCDNHEYVGACANCGAMIFNKDWKRFFYTYAVLHNTTGWHEYVYEYKNNTLLGIYPLINNEYVRMCETCGTYTAKFTINKVNDIDVATCYDCEQIQNY